MCHTSQNKCKIRYVLQVWITKLLPAYVMNKQNSQMSSRNE